MTDAQNSEQLREQIEETREELGNTVEALAAKTDVKRHTKRKVEATKRSVAEKLRAYRLPLAAAAVMFPAGLLFWRRRERRKAAQRKRWRLI